jgi:hypothetical protein
MIQLTNRDRVFVVCRQFYSTLEEVVTGGYNLDSLLNDTDDEDSSDQSPNETV